jgi:hypothetical protein
VLISLCLCFAMNIPGSSKIIPTDLKSKWSRTLRNSYITKVWNNLGFEQVSEVELASQNDIKSCGTVTGFTQGLAGY